MANLKNTEIDNNLELPSGTTAQRPASPQEGQIRYNTDLSVTEFYNGSNWRLLSDTNAEATGGTVVDTDIGGVPYRIHYFTETGTDTLTVTNPGEVEYLIVAGGGGGASREGCGGGGAGGVLQGKTNLDSQPYSITVGDGGLGGLGGTSPYVGSSGENSIALGLTAIGGGRGVLGTNQGGLDGGSGGGSGRGGGAGGQAVSGQGNNGGDGADQAGGGGGGAGSPGENGVANTKSGDGGQGILTTITGINQIIAGGGGGGARPAVGGARHGVGGLGGGGTGGELDSSYFDGRPGVPNTGSGGGGGSGSADTDIGGKGGSGIVIVRYPKNSTSTTQPDRTVIATQPLNLPVPGRHFYNIRGVSSDLIDYYYLDPPFDVENRQLIYSYNFVSITSNISRVDNLALSNDGTILYLCATNDVLKYNLSRPFDIASAQLDFRLPDFHSRTEPTCFEFADNGKKFYDHQGTNGEMLQYELSTRYDIRTRTQTGSLGGFPNWGPGDPAFSPDGSRVAIGRRGGSAIRGGFCSTPFDISTYNQETTLGAPNADPSCCKWNGDGTTLYVRHASPDMVNEFSTPNPYSLVGMTFVQRVMPDTQFAAGGLHFNYNF